MKPKTKAALGAAALVLVILGAMVSYTILVRRSTPADALQAAPPAQSRGASADETTKAPDFTVTDMDGNQVKLSDLEGKPVVLNFWASWCPPCKKEMPAFQAAYEEFGEEVQFMMVNLTDGQRETTDTAKAYIEEQGYTFPIYFDTGGEAAGAYGVRSIPATLFIDANGYWVASVGGATDAETLRSGIALLTGKQT